MSKPLIAVPDISDEIIKKLTKLPSPEESAGHFDKNQDMLAELPKLLAYREGVVASMPDRRTRAACTTGFDLAVEAINEQLLKNRMKGVISQLETKEE